MSFRLNPQNPNEKRMPIVKGGVRPDPEKEEPTKLPDLKPGVTTRKTLNAKAMLSLQPATAQNGVLPNSADVTEPDPYCVIPPKTIDETSVINVGERTENKDVIAPPEQRDVNPSVVNGTEGNNNVSETVFNGTVAELVTIIKEMKDELEQEGYSVDKILDSNVVVKLLQAVSEGMTANQVKQIVKEQLAKSSYKDVCDLMAVVNSFIKEAGIEDPEDYGLSLIAIANSVIAKTNDNNKVFTLSDVKQIIDDIFFENSKEYRETVYSDDNNQWRNGTDVQEYISYVLKNYLGVEVGDDIAQRIYAHIILVTANNQGIIPNLAMLNDTINMILTGEVNGLNVSTVTELVDIMLNGEQNNRHQPDYGYIKRLILQIYREISNECILPEVTPPGNNHVASVIDGKIVSEKEMKQ